MLSALSSYGISKGPASLHKRTETKVFPLVMNIQGGGYH